MGGLFLFRIRLPNIPETRYQKETQKNSFDVLRGDQAFGKPGAFFFALFLKVAQFTYLILIRLDVLYIHERLENLFWITAKPEGGMETYLTIDELAEYLKLARQTIRRWVLNREIPFHKIKKVIRFRVSEIEQWINNGGGLTVPTDLMDDNEGDLFDDVISLDELAELEQAEEQREDDEV